MVLPMQGQMARAPTAETRKLLKGVQGVAGVLFVAAMLRAAGREFYGPFSCTSDILLVALAFLVAYQKDVLTFCSCGFWVMALFNTVNDAVLFIVSAGKLGSNIFSNNCSVVFPSEKITYTCDDRTIVGHAGLLISSFSCGLLCFIGFRVWRTMHPADNGEGDDNDGGLFGGPTSLETARMPFGANDVTDDGPRGGRTGRGFHAFAGTGNTLG